MVRWRMTKGVATGFTSAPFLDLEALSVAQTDSHQLGFEWLSFGSILFIFSFRMEVSSWSHYEYKRLSTPFLFSSRVQLSHMFLSLLVTNLDFAIFLQCLVFPMNRLPELILR